MLTTLAIAAYLVATLLLLADLRRDRPERWPWFSATGAAVLLHAGVPEDQLILVYNIVDKLERDPRDVLERRLADAGIDAATSERLFSILATPDLATLRSSPKRWAILRVRKAWRRSLEMRGSPAKAYTKLYRMEPNLSLIQS